MSTNTRTLGRRGGLLSATHLSALLCLVAGLAGCGGHGGGDGPAFNPNAVRVDTVDPSTGPFIGGTSLTVHGANFALPPSSNAVTIGGKACTNVVTIDKGTITCTTPAGTPGMAVDVEVSNPQGLGRLTDGFRYFSAASTHSDLNHDGIADLIVGAPLDGTSTAGAVYVFFGSSDPAHIVDTDSSHADIKLLGESTGDNFGISVCTGDVNGDHIDDLIVGANLADQPNAIDAGKVYVFYGPLTAGTISAANADVKITGESVVAGDRFGSQLELGDIVGQGHAEIMVSAPRHDLNGGTPNAVVDTGCVYVFKGGSSMQSMPAAHANMTFDGVLANDQLGMSVGCGDLNHDGIADLVLGDPLADPYGPPLMQNAGAVYVMYGGAGLANRPLANADLVFTGEALGDEFGTSFSIGDVNGDGIDDLVVGAPLNSYVDANTGRVYVFYGSKNLVSKNATLADVKLSGIPTHNSFGTTVVVADVDGDHVADILIGAPHADYLNDGNGRCYLFLGGPTLTNAVAVDAYEIFNGENVQDDGLGSAVSLADINGDGRADMLCAANRNTGGAGRVYLFLSGGAAGQHLAIDADAKYSGTQSQALFGSSMARGQ
jgi:IPT/TIG domain/FG-GAP repeat